MTSQARSCCSTTTRSALTEDMQFTIAYDTLVRAGVACTSAYVSADDDSAQDTTSPPLARGSRGISILPDTYFSPQASTPDNFDLLVIPGGAQGADTISKNSHVQHLVRAYLDHNKLVAMICAGALAALTSRLPSQPLTSHPSVKPVLDKDFDYSEEPVVVSGKLVTSRGPGTAFPFALTLVELLCGPHKRADVARPMVFPSL
ncbi:hypothetical protein AcV5_000234 [Taiwanofungus camphoratus]|nr:hypothetical protein AcV5_000229 [Antrodia cinnamomea]KAI0938593.1 hypothetical protein AcV5_000234 [Antrodia cinnamomea]